MGPCLPSPCQLAVRARALVEKTKRSDLHGIVARALSETHDTPAGGLEERMQMLVEAGGAIEDALAALMGHSDRTLQQRAVEVWVRRVYQVRRDGEGGWG